MVYRIATAALLCLAASSAHAFFGAGFFTQDIELEVIGTYESGIFDEGAAEIATYDPDSERLFVTNADANTVDILDISDPTAPSLVSSIDLSPYGDGVNSAAFKDGVLAVAVEADPKQEPGAVVFFDANGTFINQLTAGALPDMVTFTPDGEYVLVANEGEPNDEYTVDPEGSITVIHLDGDISTLTQADVMTADFTAFNGAALPPSVRIFGPGATVAQDLEPEFIAVDRASEKAYVTCQENNALAIVDIASATVEKLVGLGFKDHSAVGNAFDASNEDGAINIRKWPVLGMYQPDAIASFNVFGIDFYITANEGDAREYVFEDEFGNEIDAFVEEDRVKDLVLDPITYPDAATLQLEENLGRLKTTLSTGDADGDGEYEQIYSFGARSFSIWTSRGRQIYDSGDLLERVTAATIPDDFNSTNDENDSFDNRSDDKGPEPEGVTTGRVGFRTYAFIGLERVGGIVVADVSLPWRPRFVQYINNRDFGEPATIEVAGEDVPNPAAGDFGPEGLVFIDEDDSPTGAPLLVVTNEVSGTTTVYGINKIRRRFGFGFR